MIRILCDSADANFIIESTKTLCPEATRGLRKVLPVTDLAKLQVFHLIHSA